MPQAAFSLDGHDAPIWVELTQLKAGDTERSTWYIDGFESGDSAISIKMYAKVDPTDSDDPLVTSTTMVFTAAVTTPAVDAGARQAVFTFAAADTINLLRGRVYRIEVQLTRSSIAYIQAIAEGFIGAGRPGSTSIAPSDEATLRLQGDATTLAQAQAYADQVVAGGITVSDITDIATASTGITRVGTIAAGTWHGTAIQDAYLATIATAGKVANSATTATALNTPSTIVARDASGNFAANVITGSFSGDLAGNASTATAAATATTATTANRLALARTFALTGHVTASTSSDLSGTVSLATTIANGAITDTHVNASAAIAYTKLNLAGAIVNNDISASAAIADTKLATLSTGGKVLNSATTATSGNTALTIVARDASGNFSAGTITAAVTGNASTATALQTSRTINGVAFDGTASITVTAAAGTLTGTTLASSVVTSSLTSVGTLATLTVSGSGTFATVTASNQSTLAGITLSGGGFAQGALYKDVNYGLVFGAATSAIADFSLFTPNGAAQLIRVPTGTTRVEIPGTAVVGSDPGGVELLRVGGGLRTSGVVAAGGLSVGSTISSLISSGALFTNTGNATTGNLFQQWANTGGGLTFGIETSAGGSIFTGAAAYSTVFGTYASRSLHLVTNGSIRLTIDSAGLLDILGGIKAAGLPTSAGATGTLYVDGSGFVKRA